MTILQFTHPSGERIRRRYEHPTGLLAMTAVVGAIGLTWFAFYLWSVLGDGLFVW